MKNFTLIAAMFFGVLAFGQERQARVESMQGLDVFVMNKPVSSYKVVLRMKPLSLANLNIKSLATSGLIRESASDKMNQYVNQVLRQAEKDSIHVDAIIYSGGKGAVGIVYTEENNRGLASVKKVRGVDVYAFCTPLKSHDVLKTKRATSGFIVANATWGIVDSSIDKDMEKLVKRAKRSNNKLGTTGVMYNSGKKGESIVYI